MTISTTSAKAVANHFLREHLGEISHLKLQKLVYISHGWHLGIFNEPLVEDECAEAWKYGPVFPSLYDEFKIFGSKPINRLAIEFLDEEDFQPFMPVLNGTKKIELLRKVWNDYKYFSANELSGLTHEDGTPWSETWNKEPKIRNKNIENELIRSHYKQKLQALRNHE